MKKIIYLIILTIILFSCEESPEPIKKENILDSLFEKFSDVENMSYTSELYGNEQNRDTLIQKKYYEDCNDSTGWMLNFNVVGYLKGNFHYQDVYNNDEQKLYYHSKNTFSITDYHNPPKYMPGIAEISFSLITYVKYLKQTLNDYPGRIEIKDTLINSNELYLINFSNPDGLQLEDKPLMQLNDTFYPLKLVLDKVNALPVYSKWSFQDEMISDIILNPNTHDSIWSDENMPDFFREKVKPAVNIEEKYLLKAGTNLPAWQFKTLQNKKYCFSDDKKYHLIVLFTKTCGACFREIPILNRLSENENIQVTGAYFGEGIAELPDLIKKHNIRYEVVINDDDALTKQLKNGAFPINYLVDDKGKIIYSVLGNLPGFEDEVINKVK